MLETIIEIRVFLSLVVCIIFLIDQWNFQIDRYLNMNMNSADSLALFRVTTRK